MGISWWEVEWSGQNRWMGLDPAESDAGSRAHRWCVLPAEDDVAPLWEDER
jgi:hypothetical protein